MTKNSSLFSEILKITAIIGFFSSILIYSFTEDISFSIINFMASLGGAAGFRVMIFSIDKYIIEKNRKARYYFLSLLKMTSIAAVFAILNHFFPGSSLYYITGILTVFVAIMMQATLQFIRR